MPYRSIATKAFAELLGVLSHPHRLRIIEELRTGERDVTALKDLLGISHSAVSQHLSLLRAHRLVVDRREGRHTYYHLQQPELAAWLLEGLPFVGLEHEALEEIRDAAERARAHWSRPS